MKQLGITSTNFDGLSHLIMISSAYLLLTLPFLFCMIPNQKKMNLDFQIFREKHKKKQTLK